MVVPNLTRSVLTSKMTAIKEFSVDLYEKYNKVTKLLVEDSKFDSANEPYKSKYSAREILLEIKEVIEQLLKNEVVESIQGLRLTAMLGTVFLYLGIICVDVGELSAGEDYFEKCQDVITDHSTKREFVMITLNMYNQFGIFWSQREAEKSKCFLEKAEKLYLDHKTSSLSLIDINDLFSPNLEEPCTELAWKNFEKLHTLTLYYLAQIYGTLKNTLKSAVYCHITLKRQLGGEDFDPIDWALNAATLSQFFMEQNGFKQARHHLAASSSILDKYEEELNAITELNESYEAKIEVFRHRSADVARCWAKYGLLLLLKSKERLLNHTDDIDKICTISSDLSSMNIIDSDSTVTCVDLQNLYFPALNLSQYESQVTHQFVLTIQDARLVFLNIQTWLHKAELYYTLETQTSDHIEIVQDQSQMYLNLLFFEDSSENQAKLHKRRIDLLENIIKKVNPQYYLQYCRQIWFDLGQTYYEILNIKCDKLRELQDRPAPHALSKINHMVEKSIYNFNCFIESFKEGSKKELPKRVSDDFGKAFLQAYFHIAALNSKYISLDKTVQLCNVEASYDAYKTVCDYCEQNDKSREVIPMELGICKEMVSLLPVKIAKLREELS